MGRKANQWGWGEKGKWEVLGRWQKSFHESPVHLLRVVKSPGIGVERPRIELSALLLEGKLSFVIAEIPWDEQKPGLQMGSSSRAWDP